LFSFGRGNVDQHLRRFTGTLHGLVQNHIYLGYNSARAHPE
jgi:hypothetical protein